MCCCDYSAKYLYPTSRLAANDGGKAALQETQGHVTWEQGPLLCEETGLSTTQHGLIRHNVTAVTAVEHLSSNTTKHCEEKFKVDMWRNVTPIFDILVLFLSISIFYATLYFNCTAFQREILYFYTPLHVF